MTRDIPKNNKIEYIVPALAVISLTASCIIISNKKYFWNDELYSLYLLSDQSFKHMLSAFSDKINTTPPLYFIVGWIWDKIFGSSELSLRMLSSIGVSSGLCVFWITLRRLFNIYASVISILIVFCLSNVILEQNSDARMYGLYLLISSVCLYSFYAVIHNQYLSKGDYILIFIAHSALVLTHILGSFYSAAILISIVLYDRIFKIHRYRLYITIILGWLTLIPYLPSFIVQADATIPRGWIPIPTLETLSYFFRLEAIPYSGNIIVFLIVFLFARLLYLLIKICNKADINFKNTYFRSEISMLILLLTFQAIPLIAWVLSHAIKPFFGDKYMIPTIISWCILFAYLLSKLLSALDNKIQYILSKLTVKRNLMRLCLIVLFIILTSLLLINPVRYSIRYKAEQIPGVDDNKFGYNELPIVAQFSHDFLSRFHYASDPEKYYFLLDWEAAYDKNSGLFSIQEYKHLKAIKRNYPDRFGNNIIPSTEFLNKYHRFLVLDFVDYDRRCGIESNMDNFLCPGWLELNILSNPVFSVKSIGRITVTTLGSSSERQLLLVENTL